MASEPQSQVLATTRGPAASPTFLRSGLSPPQASAPHTSRFSSAGLEASLHPPRGAACSGSCPTRLQHPRLVLVLHRARNGCRRDVRVLLEGRSLPLGSPPNPNISKVPLCPRHAFSGPAIC